MRVAAIVRDLMLYSRIEAAASAAGADLTRLDDAADLAASPQRADLAIVDWAERDHTWGPALVRWREASDGHRLIVFGRHTDLEAHRAARDAGVGPMWARSKLVGELPDLFGGSGAAGE